MRNVLPILLALGLAAGCGDGASRGATPGDDARRDDAGAEATGAGAVEQSGAPARADSGGADTEFVLLFFGNSLTAGFGVPLSVAFPARIQERIDSAGLPFGVVEAGVSGETSAAGARRIDWVTARQPIDVFVLELGGNDALRGLPTDALEDNLQSIIDRVREANPDVEIVVAGIRAPPNLGERYASRFHDVFIDLAERNDATLIPFLLEGVGGVPELNQADGIHPTGEGHARVAETVWQTLEPVMRRVVARESGRRERVSGSGRGQPPPMRVQIRIAPQPARPTSNWIGSSLEPR